MTTINKLALIPILLCFFTMGFMEIVGAGANFLCTNYMYTASMANALPAVVFFWFGIAAMPSSRLMTRIGRRKTVMLSLGVMSVGLAVGLFAMTVRLMYLGFSLLAIGSAMMHTAMNPLIFSLFSRRVVSPAMSVGQAARSLSSLVVPLLAVLFAFSDVAQQMGITWHVTFLIYLVIAVFTLVLFAVTPITERGKQRPLPQRPSQYGATLAVPAVTMSFIMMMYQVCVDAGINITAPRLLTERFGGEMFDNYYAVTLYYLPRTLGCLLGALLMQELNLKHLYQGCIALTLVALVGMLLAQSSALLCVCIALAGLANANIFVVAFVTALQAVPGREHEASGLLVSSYACACPLLMMMGMASDAIGQTGALLVMLAVSIVLIAFGMVRR